MNGKADVNLEVVITEYTQMNEEGEMKRGSPLENQVTVIVTEDNGTGVVTQARRKRKKIQQT